jgi:mannose/fructose/N-acetylgalactosamine-specific phosphotransferase system component IIB
MNTFYRVDNRLVHGQIISTWMPHLRVRTFVIVSDTVPSNSLQMTMFRMAIPSEVNYVALSVDDAVSWLNEHRNSTEPVMVLMETIDDAARLFESGHPFPMLNIGNIHHAVGRRSFSNAVYLGEPEILQLKSLFNRGIRAEIQSLPTEQPIDLRRALEAA